MWSPLAHSAHPTALGLVPNGTPVCGTYPLFLDPYLVLPCLLLRVHCDTLSSDPQMGTPAALGLVGIVVARSDFVYICTSLHSVSGH